MNTIISRYYHKGITLKAVHREYQDLLGLFFLKYHSYHKVLYVLENCRPVFLLIWALLIK